MNYSTKDIAMSSKSRPRFHHSVKSYPTETMPPRVIALDSTTSSLLNQSRSMAVACGGRSKCITSDENETTGNAHDTTSIAPDLSNRLLQIILKNKLGQGPLEPEKEVKVEFTFGMKRFLPDFFARQRHQTSLNEKSILDDKHARKDRKCAMGLNLAKRLHHRKDNCEDEEFKRECQTELAKRLRDEHFGVHARNGFTANKRSVKHPFVTGLGADMKSNENKTTKRDEEKTPSTRSSLKDLGVDDSASLAHRDLIARTKAGMRLDLVSFTDGSHSGSSISVRHPRAGEGTFTGLQITQNSTVFDTFRTQVQQGWNLQMKEDMNDGLQKCTSNLSDAIRSNATGRKTQSLKCPDQPDALSRPGAAIFKDGPDNAKPPEESCADNMTKTTAIGPTTIATGHECVMTAKAKENPMLKPGCVDKVDVLRKIVYYHNRFVVLDIAKGKEGGITPKVNETHCRACNSDSGVQMEDFGSNVLNYTFSPHNNYLNLDQVTNGQFSEKGKKNPDKVHAVKYSPTHSDEHGFFLQQGNDVENIHPHNSIASNAFFRDSGIQNKFKVDRHKHSSTDTTHGQALRRDETGDDLRSSCELLVNRSRARNLNSSSIRDDDRCKPTELPSSSALNLRESFNEPQPEDYTGNLFSALESLGTNPSSPLGRLDGNNREPIRTIPLQRMRNAFDDERENAMLESIVHLATERAEYLSMNKKHTDNLNARTRVPITGSRLHDGGNVLSDPREIQGDKCNGCHDNELNLISSVDEHWPRSGGECGVGSHGCGHRSVNNGESSGPGSHRGDSGQCLIKGSPALMNGHNTIQRDSHECSNSNNVCRKGVARSSADTGAEIYNDCAPCVSLRQKNIRKDGISCNLTPCFESAQALGSQNRTSSLSRHIPNVRGREVGPCDNDTSVKHRRNDCRSLSPTTNRKRKIVGAQEATAKTPSALDHTGENENSNSEACAECTRSQDTPLRSQATRHDETCAPTHAAVSIERSFSSPRGVEKTPADDNPRCFSTPLPRATPQQVSDVISYPPLYPAPPSALKRPPLEDSQIMNLSQKIPFRVDDNTLNNYKKNCGVWSQSLPVLKARSQVTPLSNITPSYQTELNDVRRRIIPSIVVSVYESTSDRDSSRSRPAASSRSKRDVRATSERDSGLQKNARNNLDREKAPTRHGETDAWSAGRREPNGGFTAHELVAGDQVKASPPNLVCLYESGLAGNASAGGDVNIGRYAGDETSDTRGIEKTGCDLRRSVAQTPARTAAVVRHCPARGRGRNSAPREFLRDSEKANNYGQSDKVLSPRDNREVGNATGEQCTLDITDVTQGSERASSLDLSSASSLTQSPEIGVNIRSIIKKKRTSGFPDYDISGNALTNKAALLTLSPLHCVKVHSTKDAPSFVVDAHLTHKSPDRVSFALAEEEIDEEQGRRRYYNQGNRSASSKPSEPAATTLPLDKRLSFSRPDYYYPTKSTPLLAESDSDIMDGRGIEIIVSDENDARVSTVNSGKRAVLRRIWMILLDNRVAGRPDSERALRPHQEEYRVLKRVLNIIFITIGVALLVSVFVVIIYTYVVDNDSLQADDSPASTKSNVLPVAQVEPSMSSLTVNSTITPYKTGS